MDWMKAKPQDCADNFKGHLIGVNAIADAAHRCAWGIFDDVNLSKALRQMCTITARLLFQMLSGEELKEGIEGVKTLCDGPMPEVGSKPAVVYVSLSRTGKVLDETDGHRLVIIISCGYAKVMQSSNGDFDLAEFLGRSQGSAMDRDQFKAMWEKLVKLSQMAGPAPPSYRELEKAALVTGAAAAPTPKESDKARYMREAIGVKFDGNMQASWFVERPIDLGMLV